MSKSQTPSNNPDFKPLDRAAIGQALAGVPVKPAEGAAPRPAPIPYDDPAWQAGFLTRRRLAAARIPARFASKDLASFNATDKFRKELVKNAKAYISQFNIKKDQSGPYVGFQGKVVTYSEYPKGLRMSGPCGCGKSHLAVAILKAVIEKGYSGLYYNSPDLLRDIRATFDKESELREEDLLEQVTTTDLLVFDDVGAENSTGFVLDRFYLIVNERYEGCKPVIITTNLDEQEMENRLGKRILSRIWEMCASFGPFPEEDYRKIHMR